MGSIKKISDNFVFTLYHAKHTTFPKVIAKSFLGQESQHFSITLHQAVHGFEMLYPQVFRSHSHFQNFPNGRLVRFRAIESYAHSRRPLSDSRSRKWQPPRAVMRSRSRRRPICTSCSAEAHGSIISARKTNLVSPVSMGFPSVRSPGPHPRKREPPPCRVPKYHAPPAPVQGDASLQACAPLRRFPRCRTPWGRGAGAGHEPFDRLRFRRR